MPPGVRSIYKITRTCFKTSILSNYSPLKGKERRKDTGIYPYFKSFRHSMHHSLVKRDNKLKFFKHFLENH